MKKILTIEYDALKAILESQSWLRDPEILGGYEELDTYELMRKIESQSLAYEVESENEVSDESEFTSEEKEKYTKAYLQAVAKKTVWQKNDIVIDPPEIQKASKSYCSQNQNVFVTTDEDDMYVPANFILAFAKDRHLKPNVFWLADQYNEVLQDLWKKFRDHYNGYDGSINDKDYAWFMKHCTKADNE